jgi:hypothetical protein
MQSPGVRIPLGAMPMGQAKPRLPCSGFTANWLNTACHVPTIMDWEHAGTFGAGWENAAAPAKKIDAIDATTRFNVSLPCCTEPVILAWLRSDFAAHHSAVVPW